MIANEQQYRITQAAAARLAYSLASLYDEPAEGDPFRPVVRGGLFSQLVDFEDQLAEYEARRHGQPTGKIVCGISVLPDVLISARRAAGLTPEALAERLGIAAEQVRHDEANHYAEAPLRQIAKVASVLGMTIRLDVGVPALAVSGPSDLVSRPGEAASG